MELNYEEIFETKNSDKQKQEDQRRECVKRQVAKFFNIDIEALASILHAATGTLTSWNSLTTSERMWWEEKAMTAWERAHKKELERALRSYDIAKRAKTMA